MAGRGFDSNRNQFISGHPNNGPTQNPQNNSNQFTRSNQPNNPQSDSRFPHFNTFSNSNNSPGTGYAQQGQYGQALVPSSYGQNPSMINQQILGQQHNKFTPFTSPPPILIVLVTKKSEVELDHEFGEERLRSYRQAAWNTMHAGLPRVSLTNGEREIISEFPDLVAMFQRIEQELDNWAAAQQQQINPNGRTAAVATSGGATPFGLSRPMNTHTSNNLGFGSVGVPTSNARTAPSYPIRPRRL